jgi:hypothetical protein
MGKTSGGLLGLSWAAMSGSFSRIIAPVARVDTVCDFSAGASPV